MTVDQAKLASSGDYSSLVSTNPGDGYKRLGEVAVTSAAELARKVAEAREAFPGWRALGASARINHLERLYSVIEEARGDLERMTTMEMGQPITQAVQSTDWSLKHFRWFLDTAPGILAEKVTFEDTNRIHKQLLEPYGVNGVISPWNFPLANFVSGVIQSLLVGNTIIYKISEEVPLFGKLLDKLVATAALPPGVFNQVYGAGDVGEALAKSDIDILSFTGSSKVGKQMYRICADRFIPCVLELGGSDAGIVCEDVDLDSQLEAIFWAKFVNNGQICCGLKRLLVHEKIYLKTLEKLTVYISRQPVGDPNNPDTVFGPLVAERQYRLLEEQVADAERKGAQVIRCGETPKGLLGAYYPPTLLTSVTPAMRAWGEELFGPVLSVIPFSSYEEAISLANCTQYGLSGYIFTSSARRLTDLAERMETGSISCNGCDYSEPFNPFGGYKSSGIGKTGGELGFNSVARVKAISHWRS
jgi:acyl-CoA reductase-like NAD-dependent aldehyde dehydrogenase